MHQASCSDQNLKSVIRNNTIVVGYNLQYVIIIQYNLSTELHTIYLLYNECNLSMKVYYNLSTILQTMLMLSQIHIDEAKLIISSINI